jgi:oligopeptide transport system substrate-binding protein
MAVMRSVLFTLCLALSACGPSSDTGTTGDRETALVRLTDNDARGLDPQMVSDLASIRIASDLFEGLARFDAAGKVEAGLARDWSVSADGLRWTFQLRDGLKFSDGQPIGGDVFVKALARIRDEKSGSPHASLFGVIASITANEPKAVVITLNTPFPQLPALLAHPAMAALPFHRIETAGEKWTSDRPLVTSSAYRLKDWQLAQKLVLETNPRWHGGKPVSNMVIWRPMDNLNSAMRSVLAGDADIGTDYPPSRHHWLRQKYPALVRNHVYFGTYYFAFNTRKPPFDNTRVRLALSMAVDREWIAESMLNAGNQPAWGLLPPGLVQKDAYLPDWAFWPRTKRLAAAKQILVAAGYGPQKPLSFEIRFNSSSEHRKAAVAMATMWRELGVDARLFNSEASLHFDSLKRADFQLARSGWIADLPAPENFLNVHRTSAGPQNYSGYANPAYEALMDSALSEANPARRAAKMLEAERMVMGDAAVIPLYYYATRALVSPKVTGWQDNAGNVHPSRTLGLKR